MSLGTATRRASIGDDRATVSKQRGKRRSLNRWPKFFLYPAALYLLLTALYPAGPSSPDERQ
jgi:hypothetical protein